MKRLSNVIATVTDGKLTMTADVVECDKGEFRLPAQQVTISFVNSDNPNWIRHVQISSEAIFVKSFGNGVAWPNQEFMKLATAVDPKTSFPPVFRGKPSLTVEFDSELEISVQWEVSDTLQAGKQNWRLIEGQNKLTLDPSTVTKGQFVRCIGKNEAGTYTTPPIPI